MIVIVGGDAGVEFHPIDLSRKFGAVTSRIVGRHRRPGFVADVQRFFAKGERFGLLDMTVTRLLAVDNELVVPINKVVRVQVTAEGIIHSFSVPSFGIKIDAVPGRLNETWFKAEREGIYYGQCSQLCGRNHAYMPIAVRVLSEPAFAVWLEEAKKKYSSVPGVDPAMVASTAAPARQ